MKNNTKHTDESVPQTVTGFIKLSTGQKAIQIGFTRQRVSGHAGLATFAGFFALAPLWRPVGGLAAPPTHQPQCDFRGWIWRLGFVAVFGRGQEIGPGCLSAAGMLLAPLLAIERIGSQSSYTRFFQEFTGAAANLRCFGPISGIGVWTGLCSLPEGYTLDLDFHATVAHGPATGRRAHWVTRRAASRRVCIPCRPLSRRPDWWPVFGCAPATAAPTAMWWLSPRSCCPGCPVKSGCAWCGPIRAFATARGWIGWKNKGTGLHCGGPLEPACATAFKARAGLGTERGAGHGSG